MIERDAFTLGLLLPGGGARGAYQAGALNAIAEIVSGDHNPFPVIAGVSVGAINAVALAARADAFKQGVKEISDFWHRLHSSDVFRTDFLSISLRGLHWVVSLTPIASLGIPNPHSLLDNTPLRRLISDNIDFPRIEPAIGSGMLKSISVTASSYDRGRAVTFFQGANDIANWSRARRDGIATTLTADHVLAAAALPFVFPAQRIGNEHFGDGSLRLTSPLSPAIHTGANRILVIAVRDRNPDARPTAEQARYPSLGAISGNMLDIIFMDNVDADIERTRRIDRTLSLISHQKQNETPLRDIDVMVLEPSQDIRTIARRHANAMPSTIRMLMRRLGLWGRDWRLPSYLMFEPSYCAALIDLGYHDTMARSAELSRFLDVAA